MSAFDPKRTFWCCFGEEGFVQTLRADAKMGPRFFDEAKPRTGNIGASKKQEWRPPLYYSFNIPT
jgi:hypothetical protein